MRAAALTLLFAGSAVAFSPVSQKSAGTGLDAVKLEDLAGVTKPAGVWDPFGLANLGSETTFAWFQAAELKHGRVAMLATTGYLVQAAGYHWPGMLSSDVSFESLSTLKPFDAWAAMPAEGQAQIITTIALAELFTEAKKPHYTLGGVLPEVVFPKFDFSNVDPDELKTRRCRELNNGRLAMLAIMSFVSAANIPGSVPLLKDNPMF